MYDFDVMQQKLEVALDYKRYSHTLAVMYTASALAMAHSFDVEKAMAAGLLHDCAKRLPTDELIKICTEQDVGATAFELLHPHLLHAKAGVYVAEYVYGVADKEILSAIAWHTTGKSGMSLLEKIIYTADYIEPRRNKMPRLDLIRNIAFKNLDSCVFMIISDTLDYLKSEGRPIDGTSYETYEYYKGIIRS